MPDENKGDGEGMKFKKSDFGGIYERACERKGGEEVLLSLLPPMPDNKAVAAVPNDRVLSMMAKCVFRAGFNWQVIEKKWPGFEEAFLGFEPGPINFQPDDFWDDLSSNKAIVRHGAKIRSVKDNAAFVLDISEEHGSFGKFVAAWPSEDAIGLWDVLSKRGKRLGGNTGRYFLRFIGKDTFLPGRDTVAAVRIAGLDVPPQPTAKRDLKAIQELFNRWHGETGLPYVHLSRIAAMSAGDNVDPARLATYIRGGAGSVEEADGEA